MGQGREFFVPESDSNGILQILNAPLAGLMKYWILGFLLVFAAACQHSDRRQAYVAPDNPVFIKMSVNQTGLTFRNRLPSLDSLVYAFPADSVSMERILRLAERLLGAGGVAAGDLNKDGLPDLFFTSADGDNRLYLNRGGWRFEDVTEAAGLAGKRRWSAGVSFADVNADGWLDIYVSHFGPDSRNELFVHEGRLNEEGIPLFSEKAAELGLAHENLQAVQSVFFDADLDGDLDCFVVDYAVSDSLGVQPGDRLYLNEKGRFRESVLGRDGNSTGIAVTDIDHDGWPDLLVSKDAPAGITIYRNEKKGLFKEISGFSHVSERSLGVASADLDNDGLEEIFTSSVLPEDPVRRRSQYRFGSRKTVAHNTLFRFSDQSWADRAWDAGVAATDLSHGALMPDLDGDGWKDLIVPNGQARDVRDLDFLEFLRSYKGEISLQKLLERMPSTSQSDYAFLNKKGLRFESEAVRLGLGEPGFSNGAAYADLDNDGDADLIFNETGRESGLYRNDFDEENDFRYLKLKLKGAEMNPYGYGARIEICIGASRQQLVLQPNQGYQSSQDPVLLAGLGKFRKVDSLLVTWPDFRRQVIREVAANQSLEIDYRDARPGTAPLGAPERARLEDVSADVLEKELFFRGTESDDLAANPSLPYTLNQQGPCLATGDVNGDGLDDLFIGGSKGEPGRLLLARGKKWTPDRQEVFRTGSEDAAAVFLDIEGDKDLDLLVASTGGKDSTQVRLYLNDGTGKFTLAPDRLPVLTIHASCLAVADIDRDGDPDVFIGARSVPGAYGVTPKSFLLRNEKGVLKDETPEVMSRIGLVTDAAWTDLDRDGLPDLVVAGEWMPISIFYNRKGKFTYSHNQIIPASEGWWKTMEPADLDGDGDMDFVLGNWGTNTEYHASVSAPLYLHINDLDKNGVIDALMSTPEADGEKYPLANRDEWKRILPAWPYPLPSYSRFAELPFYQLITSELRKGTLEKKAVEFRSAVLWNEGNGNFRLEALPVAAQLAPVYAILVHDVDGDGKPDILLGGNCYGLPTGRGRADAGRGLLLKGKGKGQFEEAGSLLLPGQIRSFARIQSLLFIGRNNARLTVRRF